MRPRTLAAVLGAWALATAVLCAGVHHAFALEPGRDAFPPARVLASVWAHGERLDRALVARAGETVPSFEPALRTEGATVRYEALLGEGPAPAFDDVLLAFSLAPGRDGLAATIGGRTEYATPDDLLARQAYRYGVCLPLVDLRVGVDVPLVQLMLAERFGVSVPVLRERASFRRVRFARSTSPVDAPARPTPEAALDSALAAARYLARGIDARGRFRFRVDGATNHALAGYDWPRHAGATYFLAQAAARWHEPELTDATLRAASMLRAQTEVCGTHPCIGDSTLVDLGSSALATIAFAEIALDGIDASYRADVGNLAAFIRVLQRPDGGFLHQYDRVASRAIDARLLYYSGEASLALSRAHRLLGDPRDLDAARRGVAHLAGPAWSFFGSRYYFGEEHWTCEAMADLWDRSPDPQALDFCLRWLGFWRRTQQNATDTPYDADGGYGVGPVQVPALTPVASRCEAGLVTLAVARRAGIAPDALAPLETQMARSIALLLRQQMRAASPERLGLLADTRAVDGAFPSSEVDWTLRVDFAQHAGSAMLAWLATAK
ncbi:MAG: hypothetical protein ACRENE_22940 [Polyangiaceae bacterium]